MYNPSKALDSTPIDRNWIIFSQNVAYLRKVNGLSKKKMSQLLGIGIKSLNKIESGILPPRLTVEIVYRIYDQFNISPSQQFTPLDEQPANNPLY